MTKPLQRKLTHRRHTPWHDYKSRCIYHITIVVSDRNKVLGKIVKTNNEARCEVTPLGIEVSNCISKIPYIGAQNGRKLQILAKTIMPDHIHFVLFVKEPMDIPLGSIIHGFKIGCNKALRKLLEKQQIMNCLGKTTPEDGELNKTANELVDKTNCLDKTTPEDGELNKIAEEARNRSNCFDKTTPEDEELNKIANEAENRSNCLDKITPEDGELSICLPSMESGLSSHDNSLQTGPKQHGYCQPDIKITSQRILNEKALFESDFDETILYKKGQLKHMINYVHNNPEHRWQRQQNPGWLLPIRNILINKKSYDAIGNINLLGLSRKQVWIRSAWDDSTRKNYMNDCIVEARKGKVLVSPFISENEKKVRDYALTEGHSIVQLVENGFNDLAQCPGNLYNYCTQGQILLLVPSEYQHKEKPSKISRQQCMVLNSLAAEICAE